MNHSLQQYQSGSNSPIGSRILILLVFFGQYSLCPSYVLPAKKKVLPRHELGLIKLHGIVEARVVFIVELRRPVFRVVLSGFLLERVIS